MSDNIEWVVRWTQAARRHHIGKSSARQVMRTAPQRQVATLGGAAAWQWIGSDDRGRELEVIAVQITPHDSEPYLLVIHATPTQLRAGTP